jgi:hypothetical protein
LFADASRVVIVDSTTQYKDIIRDAGKNAASATPVMPENQRKKPLQRVLELFLNSRSGAEAGSVSYFTAAW